MKFYLDTVYRCYDRFESGEQLYFSVCVTKDKQKQAIKRVYDKIMTIEEKYHFRLRNNSLVLSVTDYVELGMLSEYFDWQLICVMDDVVMHPETDFEIILSRYAKIIDTVEKS